MFWRCIRLANPNFSILFNSNYVGTSRIHCTISRTVSTLMFMNHTICNDGIVIDHLQKRYFAKGMDRGGQKKQIKPNISETSDLVNLEEVQAAMQKEIDQLREDYVQQLNVRPTIQLFERLLVKLPDNSEVPLNHLAQVTFKTSQLAVVNVSASPHAIRSVANALIESGICGNPQIQTTVIYVPLAKPSREYREQLVKNAKLLYNRCHDRLRDIDKQFQLKMRPYEKTVPKDTFKAAQTTLHTLVKQYAHKAEEMMKAKQKELMDEI